MGEENKFDFPSPQDIVVNSSQESDVVSQETFEILWQDLTKTLLNSVTTDGNCLDSCTINSESNQQHVASGENSAHGGDHVVVPPGQLPTQSPTIGSNVHQGSSSLPACETWPGDYNFSVSFSPQQKSTKGVAWTYSRIKDKLYVGKDAPCPVNFSANTLVPNDAYIRVMALYTSPEQVSEIVQRCINHSMEELQNGRIEAQHLIRCESSTATYHVDAITGRHSVVVPFENPPAGQQYSTYILKFACFGSCSGGPNRRPLMLIFTLERNNQVIGRRKLDVKICACPGRDRKTEESQYLPSEVSNVRAVVPIKRKLNSESVILSEVLQFTENVFLPLPKKSKVSPNKDGVYVLNTEDVECYEFLKQMKKFFEMCKFMKGIPPDVLSRALHHAQKVKIEKSD